MTKNRMMKIFLTTIILFFVRLAYADYFPSQCLDKAAALFEKDGNRSAVIIIESRTAEIHYVYNPEYAIERRFPPGSIAKTWTAAALLEDPASFGFNPQQTVTCNGKFRFDNLRADDRDFETFNIITDEKGPYFKCSIPKGHGNVSLSRAIVNSCNVYFLTCATPAPQNLYRRIMNLWHLDENSGLRSADYSEVPGVTAADLSPFASAAACIGEGGSVLVSPLKVAQTYAALFEGTPLMSPFMRPYRNAITAHPLNLSKKTQWILMNALSRVIRDGTLTDLNPGKAAILIAGKTGTATHYRKKIMTHAWNVLYMTYRKKKFVMCVFVYNGSGGKTAKYLSERLLNEL